jgi:adenine-specific DNA glycosylase
LRWRALALVRSDGAVLLARRPRDSLFGGLWDLPQEKPAGVRVQGALNRCGLVEQTLTHREVRVEICRAEAAGQPHGKDVRWVSPQHLSTLGLSSLTRKSLQQAGVLTSRRGSKTLRPS